MPISGTLLLWHHCADVAVWSLHATITACAWTMTSVTALCAISPIVAGALTPCCMVQKSDSVRVARSGGGTCRDESDTDPYLPTRTPPHAAPPHRMSTRRRSRKCYNDGDDSDCPDQSPTRLPRDMLGPVTPMLAEGACHSRLRVGLQHWRNAVPAQAVVAYARVCGQMCDSNVRESSIRRLLKSQRACLWLTLTRSDRLQARQGRRCALHCQ